MKRIWKTCLGLTASLLAVSVHAAPPEPIAVSAPALARPVDSSSAFASFSPNQQTGKPSPPPRQAASIGRPVSAGSGPSTNQESRPASVSLERPRVAGFGVQRTAFEESPRPVVRAQSSELMPSPGTIPMPRSVAISSQTGAPGYPMFPAPTMSAVSADGIPGFDAGINPDRFATGDGVSHEFTNFFSLDTEYLLWKMRGSATPPLLTSSTGTGDFLVPGALSSHVLFGGDRDDTGSHSGIRTRFTLWCDRDHTIGLEGSYFALMQGSDSFGRASGGDPLLAVPFATSTGQESAVILANSVSAGGASAALMSRLWGAEANIRGNVLSGSHGHLDVLGGFRALGLDDSFEFAASRTIRDGTLTQSTLDSFATRNRFYGGQFGVDGEMNCGKWSLGLTTKLALGNTTKRAEIGGSSLVNGIPGATGLFVGQFNRGTFNKNSFSFVPEFQVKLGYQLTDCIRATLGYNFLYWTETARATEQIDRVLSGTGHPAFAFKHSDFWAQGLTAGLEFRY